MSDIFISYANEDRPRAQRLAEALAGQGWSIFWDRTIPTGKTWREVIGAELEQARCIVVLWSEASIDSDWVQEEADEGRERGILIPVLIDAVRPPIGFRSFQTADLSDWDGSKPITAPHGLIMDITGVIGLPPVKVDQEELKKAEADAQRKAALEEERRAEEEKKRKTEEEDQRRTTEAVERTRVAEQTLKHAEAKSKAEEEESRAKIDSAIASLSTGVPKFKNTKNYVAAPWHLMSLLKTLKVERKQVGEGVERKGAETETTHKSEHEPLWSRIGSTGRGMVRGTVLGLLLVAAGIVKSGGIDAEILALVLAGFVGIPAVFGALIGAFYSRLSSKGRDRKNGNS